MRKLIKYCMLDILRSKVILAYTFFLGAISLSIFLLEDNPEKGLISMLQVILIIVPLISLLYSTIYIYHSNEFIEMLLAYPLKRNRLLSSLYQSILYSLWAAFGAGAAIPILLLAGTQTGYYLILAGFLLTAVFVSLAVVSAIWIRDKMKGVGMALLIWLVFSVLYDGLLLFLLFQFGDYPMENVMLVFCSLNPIDLARIFLLLQMDIAALMGYSGAVFSRWVGTQAGMLYTLAGLFVWIFIPIWLAQKIFQTKDL
jgi:Cu-processing system permease protein